MFAVPVIVRLVSAVLIMHSTAERMGSIVNNCVGGPCGRSTCCALGIVFAGCSLQQHRAGLLRKTAQHVAYVVARQRETAQRDADIWYAAAVRSFSGARTGVHLAMSQCVMGRVSCWGGCRARSSAVLACRLDRCCSDGQSCGLRCWQRGWRVLQASVCVCVAGSGTRSRGQRSISMATLAAW